MESAVATIISNCGVDRWTRVLELASLLSTALNFLVMPTNNLLCFGPGLKNKL
jgi:hypothetical protein